MNHDVTPCGVLASEPMLLLAKEPQHHGMFYNSYLYCFLYYYNEEVGMANRVVPVWFVCILTLLERRIDQGEEVDPGILLSLMIF